MVWTDVMQGIVMFVGVLLMLGLAFVLATLLIEILPFDFIETTASWLRKTLAWLRDRFACLLRMLQHAQFPPPRIPQCGDAFAL